MARSYLLLGRVGEAIRLVDDTLPTAERLELIRETIELLVTRGPALVGIGRLREAIVTLVGAVAASSSYGLADVELRARVNLSYAAAAEDPQLAYRVARDGLDLVRHLGMRGHGFYMLGNAAELAIRIGDWDWALSEVEEAAQIETDLAARMRLTEIRGLRGIDVTAELQAMADRVAGKTELQRQSTVDEVRALVALAFGDHRTALDLARRSYGQNRAPDATASQTAARAAAWLGDVEGLTDARRALEDQPGRVAAAIRREADAALAALDERPAEAMAGFLDALRRWRELGLEFEAAVCSLDLVIMLGPGQPGVRAVGETAGAVFERLGAQPFQKLLADAMAAPTPAPASHRDASPLVDARASTTRADGRP